MVRNCCGLMASISGNGRCDSGTSGWPSGNIGVILFQLSGSVADIAALCTPGSAETRRSTVIANKSWQIFDRAPN
jgi:hypothetical protein